MQLKKLSCEILTCPLCRSRSQGSHYFGHMLGLYSAKEKKYSVFFIRIFCIIQKKRNIMYSIWNGKEYSVIWKRENIFCILQKRNSILYSGKEKKYSASNILQCLQNNHFSLFHIYLLRPDRAFLYIDLNP